jgi:purine-binding chemotaxis protein CheW
LADSVQEVLELPRAQIEKPPKFGARIENDFLRGMGRREDHLLMILSIDEVFSESELGAVREARTEDSTRPAACPSDGEPPELGAGHEARA